MTRTAIDLLRARTVTAPRLEWRATYGYAQLLAWAFDPSRWAMELDELEIVYQGANELPLSILLFYGATPVYGTATGVTREVYHPAWNRGFTESSPLYNGVDAMAVADGSLFNNDFFQELWTGSLRRGRNYYALDLDVLAADDLTGDQFVVLQAGDTTTFPSESTTVDVWCSYKIEVLG